MNIRLPEANSWQEIQTEVHEILSEEDKAWKLGEENVYS